MDWHPYCRHHPGLDEGTPGRDLPLTTELLARRFRREGGMTLTVAIGGLGAIGLPLARALDAGVDGMRLVLVSARDRDRASAAVQAFRSPPRVVGLAELAEADIVVEAAPAALFERIAVPAITAGRTLVPVSVGALLPRTYLIKRARETGARIIVPTGGLLGLDAVRAAAEGPVESVTLETRKPPAALADAPGLSKGGVDLATIQEPVCVFRGNALEAAQGFPANANVAAALALAGIGPVRTKVEIWADPGVSRNTHRIRVEAETARFTMTIENLPSERNRRTSRITPLSVLACLRGMTATLKVGS
jgi:aspartate dehydrogenase